MTEPVPAGLVREPARPVAPPKAPPIDWGWRVVGHRVDQLGDLPAGIRLRLLADLAVECDRALARNRRILAARAAARLRDLIPADPMAARHRMDAQRERNEPHLRAHRGRRPATVGGLGWPEVTP